MRTHVNDWLYGHGTCPKCGRRFIGLTAKLRLSPHKTGFRGKPCENREPVDPFVNKEHSRAAQAEKGG